MVIMYVRVILKAKPPLVMASEKFVDGSLSATEIALLCSDWFDYGNFFNFRPNFI